jgi:3-oxoacyl-[acyl-carrier protein] reductase
MANTTNKRMVRIIWRRRGRLMFNNKLKTVLVTGSTGDIGREIVISFASNGWNVLCHYNSNCENKMLLEKYLKKKKYNYSFLQADFSDQDNLYGFIYEISLFNIDSLINNAGTYLNNFSDDQNKLIDIIKLFNINVFAPMMIVPQIFNKMIKRKFGRIVNISSIAAKYGSSFKSMPYGCSKLALEGITKTLSKEGAEYNVLINNIRPGVIDTDFHKKFPKNMKKRISMIPMKKMGTTKDIADIVYFVGSEQNNFITNQTISVSGGE